MVTSLTPYSYVEIGLIKTVGKKLPLWQPNVECVQSNVTDHVILVTTRL